MEPPPRAPEDERPEKRRRPLERARIALASKRYFVTKSLRTHSGEPELLTYDVGDVIELLEAQPDGSGTAERLSRGRIFFSSLPSLAEQQDGFFDANDAVEITFDDLNKFVSAYCTPGSYFLRLDPQNLHIKGTLAATCSACSLVHSRKVLFPIHRRGEHWNAAYHKKAVVHADSLLQAPMSPTLEEQLEALQALAADQALFAAPILPPPPRISEIHPQRGPAGTLVMLIATHTADLPAHCMVYFGGVPLTPQSSWNKAVFTVSAPPLASSPNDVDVEVSVLHEGRCISGNLDGTPLRFTYTQDSSLQHLLKNLLKASAAPMSDNLVRFTGILSPPSAVQLEISAAQRCLGMCGVHSTASVVLTSSTASTSTALFASTAVVGRHCEIQRSCVDPYKAAHNILHFSILSAVCSTSALLQLGLQCTQCNGHPTRNTFPSKQKCGMIQMQECIVAVKFVYN